jgi:hypothetical protein
MNRQILKPQVDVPLVVLLDKGPEGKETTSQRGDLQYQYTVNNDACVMWLPPEARAAILRTGAQAGDQLQIVKSLRGNNAIWSVQVLADSEPPPPPPPTRMVAPRPTYAAAPSQNAAPSQPNGNGHHQAPAPTPLPPLAAEPHPIEQLMLRCFIAGGRTLWKAYLKLREEGCSYDTPTIEDVRAAGITLYIERTKNGGVQ